MYILELKINDTITLYEVIQNSIQFVNSITRVYYHSEGRLYISYNKVWGQTIKYNKSLFPFTSRVSE